MRHRRITAWLTVACVSISMTPILGADVAVQEEEARAGAEGRRRKNEKKRQAELIGSDTRGVASPVLWTEPADINDRDLFYGPGGKEGAPNPGGRFEFVGRDTSGTQEKIIVKDDRDREWTVKFGPEARPETAATRIAWAAGYHVDQDFFVQRTHIEGRGGFDVWDVRFERRDDGLEKIGYWSWDSNPFLGTRELQGLKVVTALLKNWDLKTGNNKIVRSVNSSNKDIYYVADLGGTLGATGSFMNKLPFLSDIPPNRTLGRPRGKGDPEAFSREPFIEGVDNGEVVFHHGRKRGRKVLRGVTIENARWMGNLLARLSDKQLGDAFRAGGFNDSQAAVYVRTLRGRIRQLQTLDEHFSTRQAQQ